MSGNRRTHILVSLLLIAVTLAVFWQILDQESISYDDSEYVFDNPNVQHGFTSGSVKWAFTTTYDSNWHPVTWLSHMLDYQLYGPDPGDHHATSLLFHTANVLLLFFLQLGVRVPERQSGVANLPCNKAQMCKNSETRENMDTHFLFCIFCACPHLFASTWWNTSCPD